jgi:ribosomal protein S6--L-glutamate ligase
MILSFHPCYEAHANRLCAGREPDASDLEAIRKAEAVILPQGCREPLYRMARENCAHLFPNYDARFQYPGKTGQAKMFDALRVATPRTWVFDDLAVFRLQGGVNPLSGFPLVVKLGWGGEGETVFLVRKQKELDSVLALAEQYERTGQRGFLVQKFVPHDGRSLRVAVIGKTLETYWRVQDRPGVFGTSLAKGARIETKADPLLRRQAVYRVEDFCRRSGINLAGIDVIFDSAGSQSEEPEPLFLEVNYFFGRTGLGGSERYYTLFQAAVDAWLAGLGQVIDRPDSTLAGKETP